MMDWSIVDLILPLGDQLRVLVQSVLLGVLIGLVYDLFRALRRYFRLASLATAVCDTLFWLLVFALLFLFGIAVAAGQNRYYVWLGLGLGAVCYFWALSMPVCSVLLMLLRTASMLVDWCRRAIDRLCQLVRKVWARMHKVWVHGHKEHKSVLAKLPLLRRFF